MLLHPQVVACATAGYDAFGRLTEITDAQGHALGYGAYGRLIKGQRHVGGFSTLYGVGYQPSLHYYFRNHQGSNRVVARGDGSVEQVNTYYPFGSPWGGYAVPHRKYLGKELDRVHGQDWYDYGARRYDPALGLFTQTDPLCEQYPHFNPYLYCAADPVNHGVSVRLLCDVNIKSGSCLYKR